MFSQPGDEALYAVVALIVAMALLEVVLLAGPAFAVGARRQQRNLALIAASGGTPRQLRRVVLASAVVLGGAAATVGVALGVAGAFGALPLVQQFSDNRLGPFDVPWLHLALIGAFGLLSALLTALVPAEIAARQDVVCVLAGRRGDRRPSLRSPIAGLLLLGLGVAGAGYGAVGGGNEISVAVAALVSGSPLGTSALISRDSVPEGLTELDDGKRTAIARVLTEGGAVVFTSKDVDAAEARIHPVSGTGRGKPDRSQPPVTVPAVYIRIAGADAPLQAVLSPQVADRLDLETTTTSLLVEGPIPKSAEADISEAVAAMSPDASFYVERGYQNDGETRIALLVLGAVGAVLMLGGTLTATSLALSDAKPDLATLSAVGAAPRMRRAVAAAYAGTVGLVGATLGAAVGFIPGIAVTYPLTSVTWTEVDAQGRALPDHFVDVPWLLIGGIVVVLPLLTALIVGLTARSRLPMVARVE